MILKDLNYNIHCQCGGSLTFKVNSVDFNKQYTCPNCSANLSNEIIHLLVNIKDSLNNHCENHGTLNNVKYVYLSGRLI